MRKLLFLLVVVCATFTLFAQSTSDPTQLLQTVVQSGAYVETFTEYCASLNRAAAAKDVAELRAWSERNHWPAVQLRFSDNPALSTLYANSKVSSASDIRSHRFQSAFRCGLLSQELRSAAHDPSVQYSRELQALDSLPATGNSGATEGASGEAASRPQSPAPTPSPSTPGVSGPITVGAATFTPASRWRVVKNTADQAVLQTNTQHTKAVILVTELPLTGDFRTAFFNTLRSEFPGTGLQFKFPREGVTAGGSPIITVLDTGVLRGTKQYENLAAVGVAIGGKLQLAMLINGDWGGESVAYRNEFRQMITGWKLKGESGPVWDPLHPPPPVNSQAGFYMGARMQNQLNPLGGMDLRAIREYLVLLPTGQAFHGLPRGGHVLDMNFAAECSRLPEACGTYRIQSGHIDFTWQTDYGMVTHESSPFAAGGPGVSNVANFNGTRAFNIAPVHNLHISGHFTSTFFQAGSAGIHSSVTAQTFIAFSSEGTYQKSGFSAASFGGGGASGAVQSTHGVERGRYVLEGYTLTLTPDSGPSESFTTLFEKVESSPKVIFINDASFLRDGSY